MPDFPDPGMARRIKALKERRKGCWCEGRRRPCPEHEAFDDGFVAGFEAYEQLYGNLEGR